MQDQLWITKERLDTEEQCEKKIQAYKMEIEQIRNEQKIVFEELKQKYISAIDTTTNLLELFHLFDEMAKTRSRLFTTYREDEICYLEHDLKVLNQMLGQ